MESREEMGGTEGRGEGGAHRGAAIRALQGKVGSQNAAPLPAPPHTTGQCFIPSLAPFFKGKTPPKHTQGSLLPQPLPPPPPVTHC